MLDTELARSKYRPQCISTLFVGEAPPATGKFFYRGKTALARHMEQAMRVAGLADGSDFLTQFKMLGWYLDDLVLEPVDQMPQAQRQQKWRAAQSSLTDRIRDYQPGAIVALLLGIRNIVEIAVRAAGSNAPCYAVPCPGNGQQRRFREEMASIISLLPRSEIR